MDSCDVVARVARAPDAYVPVLRAQLDALDANQQSIVVGVRVGDRIVVVGTAALASVRACSLIAAAAAPARNVVRFYRGAAASSSSSAIAIAAADAPLDGGAYYRVPVAICALLHSSSSSSSSSSPSSSSHPIDDAIVEPARNDADALPLLYDARTVPSSVSLHELDAAVQRRLAAFVAAQFDRAPLIATAGTDTADTAAQHMLVAACSLNRDAAHWLVAAECAALLAALRRRSNVELARALRASGVVALAGVDFATYCATEGEQRMVAEHERRLRAALAAAHDYYVAGGGDYIAASVPAPLMALLQRTLREVMQSVK
jgi:hypothetical protein